MPPPDPDNLHRQFVVVYLGPDTGNEVVYSTAYGKSETQRQVLLCAERNGRSANVRSIAAHEYARTRGRDA